jgi:pyrroline-5-carboxylate reductase
MRQFAIFGLGNMGEAILKALLESGTAASSIVGVETKKDRAEFISRTYGITMAQGTADILRQSTHLFIAVKPQDSRTLFKGITPFLTERHLIISIMAGITMSNILSMAGKDVKVCRIMPNIAAKVGEAAMGITFNHLVPTEDIPAMIEIMTPLGVVVQVGEELMDAVTALADSGPAFFLLFLEGMIDGGVRMGIPRDKSRILAMQVVKGIVKTLEVEGTHPTVMREMVTSPGGTTIAGLAILEERAFKGSVIRALEEACRRGKELSQ